MPNTETHLAQAEHNQQFVDLLLTTPFTDWVVTGCFYKTVHLIDAFFAEQHRKDFSNHGERQTAIQRDPKTRPLYFTYRLLYDLSRDARYDCRSFSVEEIRDAVAPLAQAMEVKLRRLLTVR